MLNKTLLKYVVVFLFNMIVLFGLDLWSIYMQNKMEALQNPLYYTILIACSLLVTCIELQYDSSNQH